ncbi:hypothetical protein TWF481_003019 [Arthrobotrys musiformis]|uniref:Transposase Tc1-like domain-containing protein n=1 Tax=Arthrobotrys musiformis TaxID=47236 RepID=A0AAV9VU39_9PEZI
MIKDKLCRTANTRSIAEELKLNHQTISTILKRQGFQKLKPTRKPGLIATIRQTRFQFGKRNRPRFNLSFIVDHSMKTGTPMIGVSVDYRVSAWGFISGSEVAGSKNLNIRLKDQRLALQWTHENIKISVGIHGKSLYSENPLVARP